MSKTLKRIIILAVVLVVFILFAVTFFKKYKVLSAQREEISRMSSQVSEIQKENDDVSKTIENGTNESYIEQAARENGYVKPEERVYYDSDQ